jgi:predicted carbohydrate-binding protein with CBM5 and CBM33 domain
MHKTNKHVIAAACATLLGGASTIAAAHGSAEYPISRQYGCYKNNNQSACQAAGQFSSQAVYDWNGVLQSNANGNHRAVIPDGKLCAGGQQLFAGFDLPRNDWAATAWAPGADGRYEYRYTPRRRMRRATFSSTSRVTASTPAHARCNGPTSTSWPRFPATRSSARPISAF